MFGGAKNPRFKGRADVCDALAFATKQNMFAMSAATGKTVIGDYGKGRVTVV